MSALPGDGRFCQAHLSMRTYEHRGPWLSAIMARSAAEARPPPYMTPERRGPFDNSPARYQVSSVADLPVLSCHGAKTTRICSRSLGRLLVDIGQRSDRTCPGANGACHTITPSQEQDQRALGGYVPSARRRRRALSATRA